MRLVGCINKEEYCLFYATHNDIPVFCSPWWLDVVCGKENWDAILVKDLNGNILATFPYYINKMILGKRICMPCLTQKMGPYIIYENILSETKKISYENEIFETIINNIPRCGHFSVNFNQGYYNWLQFYWCGFKQTTHYSYRINNIKDKGSMQNLYSSIKKFKKYDINKLSSKFSFKIGLDTDTFYDYFLKEINNRKDKILISRNLFNKVVFEARRNNSGELYYVIDNIDNICAISFVIWDSNSAYYLMAMRDDNNITSGSTEFLVYKLVEHISKYTNSFDFEGSMIQGVERSYRYYGTEQTKFYNINKAFSLPFKFLNVFKLFKN